MHNITAPLMLVRFGGWGLVWGNTTLRGSWAYNLVLVPSCVLSLLSDFHGVNCDALPWLPHRDVKTLLTVIQNKPSFLDVVPVWPPRQDSEWMQGCLFVSWFWRDKTGGLICDGLAGRVLQPCKASPSFNPGSSTVFLLNPPQSSTCKHHSWIECHPLTTSHWGSMSAHEILEDICP